MYNYILYICIYSHVRYTYLSIKPRFYEALQQSTYSLILSSRNLDKYVIRAVSLYNVLTGFKPSRLGINYL